MKDDAVFPCTKCGECCRHLDLIPQLRAFDTGNGTCRYLQGSLCSIYPERPLVCRVDAMYQKYFSDRYTKEEFYQMNLDVCRQMQKLRKLAVSRGLEKKF